jgi:signal transduction histidine kinase
MTDALHALGRRLETHVARERDFTRDASHELRTPLTVIRVATDLIGHDDGLSARSRRSLARIQDATESMESLMSALLLLARDSDVPLETEDFDVREVVEHEVEKVRHLVEDKGVALEVDGGRCI